MPFKNRWTRRGLIALAIVLFALALLRTLQHRKALSTPPPTPAQAVIQLAPGDIVMAQTRELTLGLPISGTLKAVNSAFIKARVAGELQDLRVREGDRVQKGQEIAHIDPTETQARLRQAQEQADAAKAQVDIAQRQADNNQALVQQGFISKTALDTASATLLGAQASYKAALAAVDVARKALDDTVLRSPIAGQVAQRLAQPGERVAVDARVVEVVDLSRLELEAALSAVDSMHVQIGQRASLTVEGNDTPVAARVVRINPSAQAGSRSVLAYLAVEPHPALRQGLFAQGQLGTQRVRKLTVPLSAVRTDLPKPYVQAIAQGQITHVPVQTGARGVVDGVLMVSIDGLAENTEVLAGQLGPLRVGTRVQLMPATAGR